MTLDPDLEAFLARLSSQAVTAPAPFDAAGARRNASGLIAMLNHGRSAAYPVSTDDRMVGTSFPRPARLYTPVGPTGPIAGMVYFHGGGLVFGDLETHDLVCRRLAAEAGLAVLAVDYRLAPEWRFPAAFDDAVEALAAVLADPRAFGMVRGRVGVGGDSAGATLAAAAAQAMRDAGSDRPAFQLLICPGTDLVRDFASHARFAEGYFFSLGEMRLFARLYAPDEADRRDVRASPLRAVDFAGLPPAIVATAGYDLLQDDGMAYADALAAAGVAVERLHEPSMIHGYVLFDALGPGIAAAAGRIGQAVRRLVATL